MVTLIERHLHGLSPYYCPVWRPPGGAISQTAVASTNTGAHKPGHGHLRSISQDRQTDVSSRDQPLGRRYLGCCSVFSLAASSARLAIHTSYSGVPRCAVLKGIAFVKSSNPFKTGRVHRRNANDAA